MSVNKDKRIMGRKERKKKYIYTSLAFLVIGAKVTF